MSTHVAPQPFLSLGDTIRIVGQEEIFTVDLLVPEGFCGSGNQGGALQDFWFNLLDYEKVKVTTAIKQEEPGKKIEYIFQRPAVRPARGNMHYSTSVRRSFQ